MSIHWTREVIVFKNIPYERDDLLIFIPGFGAGQVILKAIAREPLRREKESGSFILIFRASILWQRHCIG